MVLEIVFGFVMEVLMYGIGRAAIAVLTFGRARAERRYTATGALIAGWHW